MASNLPNAEVTAPCAFWYAANFSGVRSLALTCIWVALLRASTTPSSVSFSWEAYPFTVFTRLGIRSARRWYCVSTFAHWLFTFSSIVTNPLYILTAHITITATTAMIMIIDFFIFFFVIIIVFPFFISTSWSLKGRTKF